MTTHQYPELTKDQQQSFLKWLIYDPAYGKPLNDPDTYLSRKIKTTDSNEPQQDPKTKSVYGNKHLHDTFHVHENKTYEHKTINKNEHDKSKVAHLKDLSELLEKGEKINEKNKVPDNFKTRPSSPDTNDLVSERKNTKNFIEINRQLLKNISRCSSRTSSPTRNEDDRPLVRTVMNWDDYHRLYTIHDFMDNLESTFPSICTTGSIGKSLEGRDLKILKISNSNAKNKAVWMDAGIHAREWIAPATATFIADHIARNFDKLPKYITNKDWYFLPVMNPDGYEYSHTNDRMWRKNRAWHGGKCLGVDLNRNFSIAWGGKESSDDPTNAFYHGPVPFSEPESTAVRDMLVNSGVTFTVYMSLHSYGQIILFPYAHRDEPCEDYIKLLEGATLMSKAIYEASGNTYKVGISRDVLYGAAGTSTDWSYGAAGIPYCYLFELRSKKHKFRLPKEEIQETGNEILSGVHALMSFVDSYKPPKFKIKEPVYEEISETQVWVVTFIREGQRHYVRNLDTVGAINIWKEEHNTMDIMVEGHRITQVASMLHEREIPYSVAVTDVGHLVEKERGPEITVSALTKITNRDCCSSIDSGLLSIKDGQVMNWANYHRLDDIYAFLDSLEREYPYLCSVMIIGTSVEGRPLKVLKISNGESSNVGVWFDAAIHPREWISTAVVTYIADRIVRTFHEQPDSITNKDWYILPVLNPDGYEYTHKYDRMWRKNRARYGECVGVDLNRNFSYGWGENGEEGSSEDPGNIFFRGSKPFSEPETAAVKRVITQSDVPFKVFLSFHSYGEVIIFPWGYTGDPCPDYVELLEGGTAMSKAIYENSGNTYKVGSTKYLMYFAAGTSSDWAYAVANIPYAYMVELRGKKHKFLLPKEEIEATSAEAYIGVLSLMNFVDRRSKSTQSCNCPK